jgi:hypothetical protein
MQLISIALNPFEVLTQSARYSLFYGIWLLCHTCFWGCFARIPRFLIVKGNLFGVNRLAVPMCPIIA